jgi:hypothetical protein
MVLYRCQPSWSICGYLIPRDDTDQPAGRDRIRIRGFFPQIKDMRVVPFLIDGWFRRPGSGKERLKKGAPSVIPVALGTTLRRPCPAITGTFWRAVIFSD